MGQRVYPGRNRLTYPEPRVYRKLRVRRTALKEETEKTDKPVPLEGSPPKRQRLQGTIDVAGAGAIFQHLFLPDDYEDKVDEPVPPDSADPSPPRQDIRATHENTETLLPERLALYTLDAEHGHYYMFPGPPHPDATKDPEITYWERIDAEPVHDYSWSGWFISSRGNEYFCEIDEEYLTDRFNLTGLNTEVQYYQYALDLVTDVFDLDCEDEMREQIEKSARHLYGLVHARYIVTTRGLAKMVDKYKKADFGKCPRVLCDAHPLLPMGLADVAASKSVKLFCAKCEDIYNPKSSRHAAIDGAYFGSSFHNILFQVYPALIPEKSRRRCEPRIFGFKVHAAAALARWQDDERRAMKKRLALPKGECNAVDGVGVGFIEDREGRGTDSEIDEDIDEGEDELGLAKEEVKAPRG